MMKNKFIYLVFLLNLVFPVSASVRGKQEVVKAGSYIYDLIAAVSIESGITNFTENTPITIGEIKLYLQEIDYDSLSKAGKRAYDSIMTYVQDDNWAFESGILSFGFEPYISLEGYYKTSDEVDWIYDRYNRKPLLYTPMVIAAGDYATISMDLLAAQNKGVMTHNDTYVNIPFSANQFDINFPDDTYFSVGADLPKDTGFNFQIGSGGQDIGRSLSGSVIQSRYMTGATYTNLEFYSHNFKFSSNVTQFYVDKYLYSHQFDIRFFNKVQFNAIEAMMVYAPMELRFLNPITIFHGMSPWKDYGSNESNTCAYLCLRLTYVPVKNIRLYGMFAQDQLQTLYEREHWPDDVTPNGIGFQVGAESYVPAGEGYVHSWGEFYYADPYFYVKESPNWSLVRTYAENIGDCASFYEWVGSPFGPDTIAGELNVGYEVPAKYSVTLSYLFKACGEYSGNKLFKKDDLNWGGSVTAESGVNHENWAFPIDSDKDESDNIIDPEKQAEAKRRQALMTPSGIPEFVNRISVRGTYHFTDFLSVTVQPGFTFIFNKNNEADKFASGFEIAVSATLNLSRGL